MIIRYIIIHHEAPPVITNLSRFDIVNEYHKQRFHMKSELGYWCGYQYFIEKDGTTIQARKDMEEGAHTIGHNKDSIGICLAGNFDLEMPTEAQKTALKSLLRAKMALYSVLPEKVVPHRTFTNKSCFGAKLSDSWARDLLAENSNDKITLLKQMVEALKKTVAALQRLLQIKQ